MAAAYAARKLGLPATVVVPSSTGPGTVRRLQELGATVEVCGKVGSPPQKLGLGGGGTSVPVDEHGPQKRSPPALGFGSLRGDKGHIAGAPGLDAAPLSTPRAPQVWDEANRRALQLADTPGWVSVHPFDHPLVW